MPLPGQPKGLPCPGPSPQLANRRAPRGSWAGSQAPAHGGSRASLPPRPGLLSVLAQGRSPEPLGRPRRSYPLSPLDKPAAPRLLAPLCPDGCSHCPPGPLPGPSGRTLAVHRCLASAHLSPCSVSSGLRPPCPRLSASPAAALSSELPDPGAPARRPPRLLPGAQSTRPQQGHQGPGCSPGCFSQTSSLATACPRSHSCGQAAPALTPVIPPSSPAHATLLHPELLKGSLPAWIPDFPQLTCIALPHSQSSWDRSLS